MKVLKVAKLHKDAILPKRADALSSGLDLYTHFDVTIPAGKRVLVDTGIAIELEPGYEAQVRPKSGLALKHGISVVNTPGTIDCGFKNSLGVILINTDTENAKEFKAGDKIAQLVVQEVCLPEVVEVETVYEGIETERGFGGFGSTGAR